MRDLCCAWVGLLKGKRAKDEIQKEIQMDPVSILLILPLSFLVGWKEM